MIGLDLLRQLRGTHVAWAVLAAMLLSSLLHLPRQLETVLPRALDLAAQWNSPAAQTASAIDAPHQLFWQAEAVLPDDAVILLTTAAWDPEIDEALLWRARYELAPRRIEPFVTTGEAGLGYSSVDQLALDLATMERARQRGATHLLSIDPAPRPSASGAVSLDFGSLVPLTGDLEPARIMGPQPPKPLWPLYLAAALAVAILMGDATAKLLRVDSGRFSRWAVAWVLGSALLAWAMLVLSLCGLSLDLQLPTLALFSVGLAVLGYRTGADTPVTPTAPVKPSGQYPRWLLHGLVGVTLAHGALVALLALGRPWLDPESWGRWGLASRGIFRRGTLPTDPIELGHALGLPLNQAWISTWLGRADERLLGFLPLLSWIALLVVLGSAVQRFGGSRLLSWMAVATVATSGHLWSLAGRGVPDSLLAGLATVAALSALRWQMDQRRGDLVLFVTALGLLPTFSAAGTLLAVALILALVITTEKTHRTFASLALPGLSLALFAFPGWSLLPDVADHLDRGNLPPGSAGEVLMAAGRVLVAPGSAAVWILLLQVVLWRFWSHHPERRYNFLLVAALCYLGLSLASYLWRPPIAGQADQLLWRHSAHVLPLAVLWLALHGADRQGQVSAANPPQQHRSSA